MEWEADGGSGCGCRIESRQVHVCGCRVEWESDGGSGCGVNERSVRDRSLARRL